MSPKINRRTAATGAVIIGLGWLSFVSPGVAQSLPAVPPTPIPIQPNDPFTCPGGDNGGASGDKYIVDAGQSNAYYVCSAGLAPQHLLCPAWSTLHMTTTPPTCIQWRAAYG
jgi:hypothetical protein